MFQMKDTDGKNKPPGDEQLLTSSQQVTVYVLHLYKLLSLCFPCPNIFVLIPYAFLIKNSSFLTYIVSSLISISPHYI